MSTSLRLSIIALALLATTARADEWVRPTERTFESANQKVKAVITPPADGRSPASVNINPKKGAGAVYTLSAPAMPVDAVVFDDGSLLTLDNWHQLGYGKVATLYEPDGKVRWTKTLLELVGQKFIDRAQHSVSSIWWRKTPLEWTLAKDGRSGLVTLFDEDQLKIVLRDGGSAVVGVANLPDDPPRLLNRARSLAAQDGQAAAAIALLERAIAKDPDMLEAALLYVEILQRTNDHAKAVAMLDRVSPRWKTKDGYGVANVCGAWATSLVALSRHADAERVLRRAVAAAPVYTNPAIALAGLLVGQNRRKDADVVLDDFVGRLYKASYLDSHALVYVADFYKKHGDKPKALALLLKGSKAHPVSAANQYLLTSLATLYEETGNDAEAIRIHEQLLLYFQKMGSAFDMYAKSSQETIDRIRAKKRRP